ncbi:unnamed protein product [Rotaria socialis]|uniref:Uncharacterized protein n=1 Tax=Rotaria socialis TaxID=392032 RepID=A0A817WWN7_9BILA|nr:unnamed protein product [Rotaria socialis]CAF4670929.1 unnamed protein product [Rotaria socialis]
MTSSSSNILQNCLNETSVVSAPVSSNMLIDSPTKKRSLDQTNINSKPVVPAPVISSPTPISTEPVIQKVVQHVKDIQQVSSGLQAQDVRPFSHPQQISITTESTRYAQTRYPFPAFIIRFSTSKATSNKIKEDLIDHCIQNYQMEINILNCRLSNRSSSNEYDFLIFLKDSSSFSFLLNQNNWPDSFSNGNYIFPYSPAIPPQLSLSIKNVDLRLDFNEFGQEIKTRYPRIKNVIRLKTNLTMILN